MIYKYANAAKTKDKAKETTELVRNYTNLIERARNERNKIEIKFVWVILTTSERAIICLNSSLNL